MVEKHFPIVYSVLISFFISITTLLMILLFIEYRFFCMQAYELSSLKQQYSYYIDVLHKKISGDDTQDDELKDEIAESISSDESTEDMIEESSMIMDEIVAAESSDAPDNDDEYMDDSFVVINRHPDYLKQSTFDYIESQELNALMTAIDIDRWSDYTESFSSPVQTVIQNNKVVAKKKPSTAIAKVTSNNKQQNNAKNNVTNRISLKECGFIWPIDTDKFWLSSLFGPRKRVDGSWGFHHGIDMAAVKGTIIHAVRAGTVAEASFQTGYGNTVVIKHTENIKTRYAHLHTIRAYVGQKVKQGAVIGTVGETGFIRKKGKDGSHLHFEVYEHGKRINPLHCLPRMT